MGYFGRIGLVIVGMVDIKEWAGEKGVNYFKVEHCNLYYRRVANDITNNSFVGHGYHFKIG